MFSLPLVWTNNRDAGDFCALPFMRCLCNVWECRPNAMAPNLWSYFICLTLLPSVPYICVGELGEQWFREWLVACSVPSHYPNQCWHIVNWTLGNKLQWNSNRNTKLLTWKCVWIEEAAVCEITAIFSIYAARVRTCYLHMYIIRVMSYERHGAANQGQRLLVQQLVHVNIKENTKIRISLALCEESHRWPMTWRHQMETFSALLALCAGHRWILLTKVSDAELWCFLWSTPEETVT